MSMGHSAGYADVITVATLKRIAPKEFPAFEKLLLEHVVSLENFAQYNSNQSELDLDHINDEDKAVEIQTALDTAWKKLQTTVKKKSGLLLDLGYHNSRDEGDSYDEVDGAFYCVGGVWTRTPAGKKHQRSITRKFFVTFG